MLTNFSVGSTGETVRITEIAKVGEHRIKTERSHNRNWRTTRKFAQRRVTSTWPAKRLWEKGEICTRKRSRRRTKFEKKDEQKTRTTVVTVFQRDMVVIRFSGPGSFHCGQGHFVRLLYRKTFSSPISSLCCDSSVHDILQGSLSQLTSDRIAHRRFPQVMNPTQLCRITTLDFFFLQQSCRGAPSFWDRGNLMFWTTREGYNLTCCAVDAVKPGRTNDRQKETDKREFESWPSPNKFKELEKCKSQEAQPDRLKRCPG